LRQKYRQQTHQRHENTIYEKVYVGQHLSNRHWQNARMSIKRFLSFGLFHEETVAVFGRARLIRRIDGRHELIGGSWADHFAAREWCSLFQHELVFSCTPAAPCSETAFAE